MAEFHNLEIKACLKELKATVNGLSKDEAGKRYRKFGPNSLPKSKKLSKLHILLSQFNNTLVYILLFTGFLSLGIGIFFDDKAKLDAYIIFGAVVVNVIIGFFQENKANDAIAKLREFVEHKAMVLRDGNEVLLSSEDIVVGDIILINAGNRVPADSRLIEAAELLIDESMLTGESMPSHKKTEPVPLGAALADRESLVYAGTLAVNGLGRAVVISTGEDTEIGKIAELVRDTEEEKTPLQLRLGKFSRFLGVIFGSVSLLVIVIGFIQDRPFLEMLETGVALGVASIPEGLIVAVTFILALGMQRILKENALTRKLVAAETLGSTTVICTDKTGTLTEGKMHVAHIIIGENEFEVASPGTRQDEKEAKVVSLALQAGMMCNDATIENPDDELGTWRINGTPTEVALLSAAIQSGLRQDKLLEIEPQVDELPFTSDKKFMLSLHEKARREYVLYEKGAPEIILQKSSKFYHSGRIHILSPLEKHHLEKNYEQLTSQGLRVIGLAIKEFKHKAGDKELVKGEINWTELDIDLIFIGFIAIKDPLRKEAKETIAQAQSAGIRTIIITGDHQLTARAIAKEIGLDVQTENIIIGEELEKISDDELKKIISKIDIYARVSPHHKLRIVKVLQEKGEVVAMTGDGINDSPALKAADIGISLGTGTDIAKETSDIVLLDNNFKTIVSAIEQGRIIFKNIRKVITYLIADSFSEIILIVGSIIAAAVVTKDFPLAILPAQILWINIVNDGLPHFSLAFEKGHGDVMKEKPLDKNEPIISSEMKYIIFGAGIVRDLILFGFFYYLWLGNEYSFIKLSTIIFAILGVKSLMSIFSIRSFRTSIWRYNPLANRYMLAAVFGSFLLLLLSIYWPPLQSLLHTEALGIKEWLYVFSFGLISVLLIEIVKLQYVFRAPKIIHAK